jgi:hypothetical protein
VTTQHSSETDIPMRSLKIRDAHTAVAIDVFVMPASDEPYRLAVKSLTTGDVTEYRFDKDGHQTGYETVIGSQPKGSEPNHKLRIVK